MSKSQKFKTPPPKSLDKQILDNWGEKEYLRVLKRREKEDHDNANDKNPLNGGYSGPI